MLLLMLLATVDLALGQLSDVGLRRLLGDADEDPEDRAKIFLKKTLQNRQRFQLCSVGDHPDVTRRGRGAGHLNFAQPDFQIPKFVLVGLVAGLVLAGVFRQLIPLFDIRS